MGLFSPSPSEVSYVGVDIAYGGIKLVELRNEKGRARLNTYAYANVPADAIDQSLVQDTDYASDLLKKMLSEAKVSTKKAVSVIPISSVFSSILNVPTTVDKEIHDAVVVQAKKLIPVPIEEVYLDTTVIESTPKTETEKASTRVLVSAAPMNLIDKYKEIFKKCGMELTALETEVQAMIRSLIGRDRATIMIVDIGSLRTNIIIVERGIPVISRSIATGGNAITETFAKTLGIPLEQAESIKRDIKSMQTFAPTGNLAPILSVLLKAIVDEIRYTFNLYQSPDMGGGSVTGSRRIEKIIVTGGSSLLPRLPEFFTQQLGVNVYLGNPWARVVYPLDLRPVLEEMGPRFAVSIGCAMRDI